MANSLDKLNKRGVKSSYFSTIIGISLVLFMIGIVLGGVIGLENLQKQAKETLQGDIFFNDELNSSDIKLIAEEIRSWEQFREVTFVSPEKAIATITRPEQSEEHILAIFEGNNPLPPTISFNPKAEYATLEGMQSIRADLTAKYSTSIDEVSFDKASVDSVNLGFKQFAFLFAAIAILLIVIAVVLINNTIRLALYSKRFSIKTMQLVGAKSSFIRKPFLWQSIGMGVVSAIIALALLLALFYALNNVMETLEITYTPMMLVMLASSLIISGIIITFTSTWFALNKYLRLKLDELY